MPQTQKHLLLSLLRRFKENPVGDPLYPIRFVGHQWNGLVFQLPPRPLPADSSPPPTRGRGKGKDRQEGGLRLLLHNPPGTGRCSVWTAYVYDPSDGQTSNTRIHQTPLGTFSGRRWTYAFLDALRTFLTTPAPAPATAATQQHPYEDEEDGWTRLPPPFSLYEVCTLPSAHGAVRHARTQTIIPHHESMNGPWVRLRLDPGGKDAPIRRARVADLLASLANPSV